MGEIGKRLTAPATLILLALIVSVILVPVAASAHHRDDHVTGKGQSSDSATVPVPTAGSGDHDGDADLDPVTTIEDSHEEEVGVDDNQHPSGKDRSGEPGGSGNQGKSESDPDDNVGPMRNECGASPASDPRGKCTDKPGGSGGMDLADQDGNNGCGNDDDFDDDNNGHCGGKAKDSPPPPGKPETPPSKPETPPSGPSVKPEGPTVKPPIVKPEPDKPGEPRVKRRQVVSEEPPARMDRREPAPAPAQLPFTGPEETLAYVMFGFALLLLGGGMLQFVSVRPTL